VGADDEGEAFWFLALTLTLALAMGFGEEDPAGVEVGARGVGFEEVWLGGGGEVGGGFDVEGGVCYCSYGGVLDVLEGPHSSKVLELE
jgi:hypothetical protein